MKRLITVSMYLVLLLACLAPLGATVLDSTLTGSGSFNLGSVPVHAEALFADNIWTYTYTLNITGVTANVTAFTIGNLEKLSFTNAYNNKTFTNPQFSGTGSILWTGGNVPSTNGPIIFSFQSVYGPKTGNTTLTGGYKSAGGTTLTVGAPEPSSLFVLGALGLGGAATILRRKLRR